MLLGQHIAENVNDILKYVSLKELHVADKACLQNVKTNVSNASIYGRIIAIWDMKALRRL